MKKGVKKIVKKSGNKSVKKSVKKSVRLRGYFVHDSYAGSRILHAAFHGFVHATFHDSRKRSNNERNARPR